MSGRDEFIPSADEVSLDNSTIDCIDEACDVQAGFEEICDVISTGTDTDIAFTRTGDVGSSKWLYQGTVFSNRVGIPFNLNNGKLLEVWCGSKDLDTYDVTIYWHEGDEINLTSLVTVSVISSRLQGFDVVDFGDISIPKGKQLAVRITDGSAREPSVFLVLRGTRDV